VERTSQRPSCRTLSASVLLVTSEFRNSPGQPAGSRRSSTGRDAAQSFATCLYILVYLTEGRRIAVYGANDEPLTVFETFEGSDQFGLFLVADVGARSARRADRFL
jgi:hypothetical protein